MHKFGGLGYVGFAEEVRAQEAAMGVAFDYVVVCIATVEMQGKRDRHLAVADAILSELLAATGQGGQPRRDGDRPARSTSVPAGGTPGRLRVS